MTSTPQQEPGHRARRTRHRRTSTSVRADRGRHHVLTGTPGLRRARSTTLWPFGDADPLPGTVLLAGWLGRTIITLVTTYTRPGDRVLLLIPPKPEHVPGCPPGRARGEDFYAGLTEAVWTVTRLGRGVDTATAAPTPDHIFGHTDSTLRDGAQSGSGPRPCRCGLRPPTDRDDESEHRPVCATGRPHGRFTLIITAVNPRDTDWLARASWDRNLTPTGLAAVLTHSDFYRGRLVDPHPVIMSTFRHQQLGCLDHIAVLAAPLTTGHSAAATSTTAPADGSSLPAATPGPWPPRPVHHDLLLFGRLTGAVPGTDATDRQETSDD